MTRVVAFGGGHGLAASLRALRRCGPVDITAVVTVGDDGGSTGSAPRGTGAAAPSTAIRSAISCWSG